MQRKKMAMSRVLVRICASVHMKVVHQEHLYVRVCIHVWVLTETKKRKEVKQTKKSACVSVVCYREKRLSVYGALV